MAIKDVSLQYAAMFSEAADEEKKYEEACQEACKEAEEAEKRAIDEFDAEEIDPSECGFTEEDVECNEVVDPLQMWKDMKRDDRENTLVPVDNNYINKMKKLLARVKTSKKPVYDRVMLKLGEYMKSGIQLPPPEDYAENFIPFEEISSGSATPDSEDYSDATGAFGNDMADQNLWDSEGEDDEVIAADGVSEAEVGSGLTVGQLIPTFEECLKKHPYSPIHVGKSIGEYSLYGQVVSIDTDGPEVALHVVKVINGDPQNKSLPMVKASEFYSAVKDDPMILSKPIVAEVKIIGKAERLPIVSADVAWRDGLMLRTELNSTTEGDDSEVDESACQNEEDPVAHLMDPVGVKASTANLAAQDAVGMSVVESLLKKIDKLEKIIESKEEKCEEACNEEEKSEEISETAYDDAQAKKKLTYEDQLKFKRWAMRKLGLKGDPFYFDYVTGVDSETGNDLPGLMADGSMTWGQGLDALKRFFKIGESEESTNEADQSFEGDDPEEDAKIDAIMSDKKSDDLKKAEAIQEISFERELTKAEEDEFRQILGRLSDYEKDLLLSNLSKSKTGFARPGNHTNLRATDDAGNRVEIPAFNYTEDPEDHSQKKSIEKRAQKAAVAQEIQSTQDNALSSLDANLKVGDDLTQQDWQIALGTMKSKEKKELMNELIADVEANYEGRDDAESKKAREDEIWYIWKIFGYDPKTRDLGKVWKVSHLGAGKYFNRTIDKMADAFRSVGVRKIADIGNLNAQNFKKMIDFLDKKRASRRSWKIDPKIAQEKPANAELSAAQ